MAARTAYPPMQRHSAKRVSPATAQKMLAGFLEKTASSPHLHPDAMLGHSGVQYPQSGPQGGLTLHHLRRIEAGLRGEDLVAQSREELNELFAEEIPQIHNALDGESGRSFKKSKRERATEKVEEWSAVDQDQYAQEQEVVDEEIGNDTLAGTGEQTDEPSVKATKIDKAARRAAKKARLKEGRRKQLAAG